MRAEIRCADGLTCYDRIDDTSTTKSGSGLERYRATWVVYEPRVPQDVELSKPVRMCVAAQHVSRLAMSSSVACVEMVMVPCYRRQQTSLHRSIRIRYGKSVEILRLQESIPLLLGHFLLPGRYLPAATMPTKHCHVKVRETGVKAQLGWRG